ncbi:MAG: monoamine oxidase [Saprospiraceae bacterium]|jgi:monoamine oxidase
MTHTKYIIAGAGLAGLTTAYQLLKKGEEDFIILEGRDRIGGRILTHDGVDLGATWFQQHHTQLSAIVDELKVQKFRQYSIGKGVFIYSSMAPPQYFDNGGNEAAAFRIGGGSIALIAALAKKVQEKIRLTNTITSITENEKGISVQTINDSFSAEKIVLAIPPKVAVQIRFEPTLPDTLIHAMSNTHTWMSNAIKVGITYSKAFWRDKNLSGTIVGHVGPTIELYDHSNQTETTFSLMGFVNEGLRDEAADNRKERILSYIEKHLGAEARNYTHYYEKDWSMDPYTSNEKLKSMYISPQYGNPLFQDFYMNGKVLFSCAETSALHGGYMDGAVISGIDAASRLG